MRQRPQCVMPLLRRFRASLFDFYPGDCQSLARARAGEHAQIHFRCAPGSKYLAQCAKPLAVISVVSLLTHGTVGTYKTHRARSRQPAGHLTPMVCSVEILCDICLSFDPCESNGDVVLCIHRVAPAKRTRSHSKFAKCESWSICVRVCACPTERSKFKCLRMSSGAKASVER